MIRKVVYDNPLAFWRQANNWKDSAAELMLERNGPPGSGKSPVGVAS